MTSFTITTANIQKCDPLSLLDVPAELKTEQENTFFTILLPQLLVTNMPLRCNIHDTYAHV